MRLLLLLSLVCFPLNLLAQTDPPPPEEAPKVDAKADEKPPVAAPKEDELGRDSDAMTTEGPEVMPGFEDAGMVGTNEGAVITGPAPSTLPADLMGEEGPTPISGGAQMPAMPDADSPFRLDLSGFVQAEMVTHIADGDDPDLSFLPREIELDLTGHYRDEGLFRLDLNLIAGWPDEMYVAFSSDVSTWQLIDHLVEQAYIEWGRWGATLRVGKMNLPFGSEPIDAGTATGLSRSTTSLFATPDSVTGLYLAYAPTEQIEIYLLGVNGWDVTFDGNSSLDGNRSKTGGGGVRHRFVERADGSYMFEGNLGGLAGPEEKGSDLLRWVIDYSVLAHLTASLNVALELFYGEHQGEGYDLQKLLGNDDFAAQWWGGMLTVGYDWAPTQEAVWENLRGELRLEYVHDHDLQLVLPHVPRMTTLLGLSGSLRYRLVDGIETAFEYRADFERGDVKGVSVLRNVGNPFDWFVTHEVLLGMIALF